MRFSALMVLAILGASAPDRMAHAVKLRYRARPGDAVAHVEALRLNATQSLGLAEETEGVLTRSIDVGGTATSWNSILRVNPDGSYESLIEDTINELVAGGQRVNPAVATGTTRVTFDARGIIRKTARVGSARISGSDRSPAATRAAIYIQYPTGDVRIGQVWTATVGTTLGPVAISYRLLSLGKEGGAAVANVQVNATISARQLLKSLTSDVREFMDIASGKQYSLKGLLGEKEMLKSQAVSGSGTRLQGRIMVDLASGVVLKSSGSFTTSIVLRAGPGKFTHREKGEWSIYLTAAEMQTN